MRFNVLDALRGLCALCVVIFHIEFIGGIANGSLHGIPFIEHSFLFVDFFFVLSGFVLAHSYASKIKLRKDILPFMVRRFGRIYPLHLLALCAFIGLEFVKLYLFHRGMPTATQPFTDPYSVEGIFTNLTLIQALGVHRIPTWNTPSWSISVEFYTYLVFALFVVFAHSVKTSVSSKVPMLGAICLLIIIVSACIVLSCSKYYMDTVCGVAFFRCLYGFFSGVVTYYLFRKYGSDSKPGFWKSSVIEAVASFVVIGFVCLMARTDPFSVLAPPIFCVAVTVFAKEGGGISRFLSLSPFTFFGRLSYTMYIMHALVLVFVSRGLGILVNKGIIYASAQDYVRVNDSTVKLLYLKSPLMQDMLVLGIVATVLIVSAMVNKLIEDPGRIYFNGVAARMRK